MESDGVGLMFRKEIRRAKKVRKVSCQWNPAALWLMKPCTFLIEIGKQRAQSLRMKMRNAELNLKGATVIYGCSKTARTSVKVGKTKLPILVLLRVQERISEQAFN